MSQNPASTALAHALSRLLKPLVRLLMHHQMTYPFFSQLLKSIYLEVAAEVAQEDGKRITDSRLSLLSGVHRKDVRRLRQEGDVISKPEPKASSLGAQVVSAWMSDDAYVDAKSKPRCLFRLAASGEPSFESLVEEVGRQDVRARSLLDELLRLGVVEVDENDNVHLLAEAFIPSDDFDEKVFFLGHNIHDHMAASVANVMHEKPPYFERGVYYNNLSPESIEELKALVDAEAMCLLKTVNKKARAMQKRDSRHEDACRRFRFGAYFYNDVVDPDKE